MVDETAYPDFVLEGFKKIAKKPEELEDLLYQWDERCGIMHYDGGIPMQEAQKAALKEVLDRL